jgi:hypothetical protein
MDAGRWLAERDNMSGKMSAKTERDTTGDDELYDRVVEEAGRAIREAIRDHRRAGNPIAQWRDGRVVLIPPEQIEDY